MKEAAFYKKLKDKIVRCELCPRLCVINNRQWGNCKARRNLNGKLYSVVYENICSVNIDPIEKKPLYHFLPGSLVYSIGTTGCNLHCKFCQNYTTSQEFPHNVKGYKIKAEDIVEEALRNDCKGIAYTYNEPTVFYELAYDVARIARKKGLKNILVTNGFINKEPAKKLFKYVDAANVDLKSFDEKFYSEICEGKLKPVLDCLKLMKKMKLWIELTNLVIPRYNDKKEDIKKLCELVKRNLGKETPMHFSRFFPCYQMMEVEATPIKKLEEAYSIAKKTGIKYVYLGNVMGDTNTYCARCGKTLVMRRGFNVVENSIRKGRCGNCKERVEGKWDMRK